MAENECGPYKKIIDKWNKKKTIFKNGTNRNDFWKKGTELYNLITDQLLKAILEKEEIIFVKNELKFEKKNERYFFLLILT